MEKNDKSALNSGLTMDTSEIRQRNLHFLADVKYNRKQLSELMGYQASSYLNQLLSGHSRMGERTAKNIEARLDLNSGWMDTPHPHLWGTDDISSLSFVPELIKNLSEQEILDLIELAFEELKRKRGGDQ